MLKRIAILVLAWSCAFTVPVTAEMGDDFEIIEMQRELRRAPDGPRTPDILFALGEYYFSRRMPEAAAGYFRRLNPDASKNTAGFLAVVYLFRCARIAQDETSMAGYEKMLLDSLYSKAYFSAFRNKPVRIWDSPLGHQYRFAETVDRMEITLDGTSFHTVLFA